jgi:hypothetical protein
MANAVSFPALSVDSQVTTRFLATRFLSFFLLIVLAVFHVNGLLHVETVLFERVADGTQDLGAGHLQRMTGLNAVDHKVLHEGPEFSFRHRSDFVGVHTPYTPKPG